MTAKIYVLNESKNSDPRYQTDGAAGFDIASNEKRVVIYPGQIYVVSTGIRLAIPEGYEGQVRPRSSLGLKGAYIPNSPGTIDCDYRGEVKVILHNLSKVPLIIEQGDRIAQIIIKKSLRPKLVSLDFDKWKETVSETRRGAGGFGSTGEN